jgi:hypothetical protein
MRIVLPLNVTGRKLCYGGNLPATGGEPKGECNVTLADDEAGFLCAAVLISQARPRFAPAARNDRYGSTVSFDSQR